MRRWLWGATILALGWLLCSWHLSSAERPAREPRRKAYGLEKRIPWTTSKMIGSPNPLPYRTELAFARLPKFNQPYDLAHAPGTDRLFVAERHGKIYSFVNNKDVAKADLALELPGVKQPKGPPSSPSIHGIAFHPKFASNGYFFVTWVPNTKKEGFAKGSRLSRFTVKGKPPRIDLASQKIIFEWPSGGHTGGGLKFGPDGYLYLATGDGSWMADQLQVAQDLASVQGKFLRLDVDNPPRGKAYGIPPDNPFVKTKGARPEVYAYGFRHLRRFSFDRGGGPAACLGGDLGQTESHMIYAIEKGGNYGWPVMAGTRPFRSKSRKGPTPILKPLVEEPASEFRWITGGFVYRGKRLEELKGYYVYSDVDAGRIWTFAPRVQRDRTGKRTLRAQDHHELAHTTYHIMSWGEDAAGELYFVDFVGGGIHRLVKAAAPKRVPFPRKLSETGLFASTKEHKVAPGVIPYTVNAQLWSDHATKERFIAIPGRGQIGFDEITYPPSSLGSPPGWRFPDGTVLVKTFSMEMKRGDPRSRRRLETRLLHFQKAGTKESGERQWRGYVYVWNEEQTDAVLLDAAGADKRLKIEVGDKRVEQNYRFPSRAQCTHCHTVPARIVLGVNTVQVNRDHNYGGALANQLATLEHIGLFTKKLPAPPAKLPKLADFNDRSLPVAKRARAYLHANCSHCHTKWGDDWFKLPATLALEDMAIINATPDNGFGIKNARIVVPGHPERSMIHHRMSITGLGRMPWIGSRVVDESGVKLIRGWIKAMK
jgi:uncharacterized repeat protein (TIGR03806 family)